MLLDLYLKEAQQLTETNGGMLDDVCERLHRGEKLSRLEQGGVYTFCMQYKY